MLANSTPASGKTFTLTGPIYLWALAAIFVLTAFNGLFTALNVEYGGKHRTFLVDPGDRHADLIKSALAMPPFGPDFIAGRDDAYVSFYATNPYKGLSEAKRGELSSLHVTPLILLVQLGLKRAILWLGPSEVVRLYYFLATAGLALVALRLTTSWKGALIAFVVMGLSYPFLMILSRGNYGSLITTLCLIGFIYQLLVGKRVILAALLLALALNCRPNVILLTPLFLISGWRDCLRGLLVCFGAAALLIIFSYIVDTHLYPGYDFTIFQKALQNYYRLYVIESRGAPFNNSAYGAIWPLVNKLKLHSSTAKDVFGIVQIIVTLITGLLIALFAFLYLRRRVDNYEYAFALSSLYILGTTIFATYHLFFLFVFILLLASPALKCRSASAQYAILAATVLMLAPKDYIFRRGISFEVFINPLVLIIALALIFWWRDRSARKGSFWKTLRWMGN